MTISRLIRFNMQELEMPVNEKQRLDLEVWDGKEWQAGRIIQQSATGPVRIRWKSGEDSPHNLENKEYRWTELTRTPAVATIRRSRGMLVCSSSQS